MTKRKTIHKVVKVVKRGTLSKFHNYDYTLLLECGHQTSHTFSSKAYPVGKRVKCWECYRLRREEEEKSQQ